MAKLDEVVAQHRAEVLTGEKEVLQRMVSRYQGVVKRLTTEAEALTAKYSNQPTKPAAAYRVQRIEAFRQQAVLELARWQTQLREDVTSQQKANLAQGMLLEADLFQAQGLVGGFSRMPTAALQAAEATLSARSPVGKLLAGLAGERAVQVTDTLTQQLALGKNPRETGKLIRKDLGVGAARAATIARTETIRAFRVGQQAFLQENSDVCKGWQWKAHLGARTCGACLVMHGTVHPLEEILSDHPNGRCVMVPILRDETGYPSKPMKPFFAWFTGLSREEQERHFHAKVVDAILNREIAWDKLVNYRVSAEWGGSYAVRPLKELFDANGNIRRLKSPSWLTWNIPEDAEVPKGNVKPLVGQAPVLPPPPPPPPVVPVAETDPLKMPYDVWEQKYREAKRQYARAAAGSAERSAALAEINRLRQNTAHRAIFEGPKKAPTVKPKKPTPVPQPSLAEESLRIQKIIEEIEGSAPPDLTDADIWKLFGNPKVDPIKVEQLGGVRGWFDSQTSNARQALLQGSANTEILYTNGYVGWEELFEWQKGKGWRIRKASLPMMSPKINTAVRDIKAQRDKYLHSTNTRKKTLYELSEHLQMTLRREYAEKYGLQNEWSGYLSMIEQSFTTMGSYHPSKSPRSGFITIVLQHARRNDSARHTLIHEMLHGYSAKAKEIIGPQKLEEAIVESLMRLISRDVAIKSGLEVGTTTSGSYDNYVAFLEQVLGRDVDQIDIRFKLLKMDHYERFKFLEKHIRAGKATEKTQRMIYLNKLKGAPQ